MFRRIFRSLFVRLRRSASVLMLVAGCGLGPRQPTVSLCPACTVRPQPVAEPLPRAERAPDEVAP